MTSPPSTAKTSSRASGVLSANSVRPSGESASGRTCPVSKVTNDAAARCAGSTLASSAATTTPTRPFPSHPRMCTTSVRREPVGEHRDSHAETSRRSVQARRDGGQRGANDGERHHQECVRKWGADRAAGSAFEIRRGRRAASRRGGFALPIPDGTAVHTRGMRRPVPLAAALLVLLTVLPARADRAHLPRGRDHALGPPADRHAQWCGRRSTRRVVEQLRAADGRLHRSRRRGRELRRRGRPSPPLSGRHPRRRPDRARRRQCVRVPQPSTRAGEWGRARRSTSGAPARSSGCGRASITSTYPDSHTAPHFAKLLVKIGDDCFSAVLVCRRRPRPALRAGALGAAARPRRDRAGGPLAGTMVTAFDDDRVESVSVFAQEDGHYVFPRLRPGTYRVRARLLGWQQVEVVPVTLSGHRVTTQDFALTPLADANEQLPASQFLSLLLPQFPTPTMRGDFTLSCGNCHQIAGSRFRADKGDEEWREVVTTMMTYLPPYQRDAAPHPAQRARHLRTERDLPQLPVPPPPSGDVLRAVVYEYGLGDDDRRDPGCHDLELGTDGVVYADAGLRWIDPRTGERGVYPMNGGGALDRARTRRQHVDHAGEDATRSPSSTSRRRSSPTTRCRRIGDDQGAYPHTLRFDAARPHLVHAHEVEPRRPVRPGDRAVHVLPAAARPTRPRSGSRSRSPTAATSRPTAPSGGRSSSASASGGSTRPRAT